MEIKIGSILYKVKDKDLAITESSLGEILYAKGKIHLEPKQSPERKLETLMHEVLHGVFYEAGIEDQEEDVINRVGKMLTQTLTDNPLLLQKLKEGRL